MLRINFNEKGEGIDMGDPKLSWSKENYYILNLYHNIGTLKTGRKRKDLCEISCYNFYSKKEAVKKALYYKNNKRYIGDPFKKIIIIKTLPIIDKFSSELAARYVLKFIYNYKNIFAIGWPLVLGHSKTIHWA